MKTIKVSAINDLNLNGDASMRPEMKPIFLFLEIYF